MNFRTFSFSTQLIVMILALSLPADAQVSRSRQRITEMTMVSPAEYGIPDSTLILEYNDEGFLVKLSSSSSENDIFSWEIQYEENGAPGSYHYIFLKDEMVFETEVDMEYQDGLLTAYSIMRDIGTSEDSLTYSPGGQLVCKETSSNGRLDGSINYDYKEDRLIRTREFFRGVMGGKDRCTSNFYYGENGGISRIERKTYIEELNDEIASQTDFSYDSSNRLVKMDDGQSPIELFYDSRGQLESMKGVMGSGTPITVNIVYEEGEPSDPLFQLLGLDMPDLMIQSEAVRLPLLLLFLHI